jgi:hypothetical protein
MLPEGFYAPNLQYRAIREDIPRIVFQRRGPEVGFEEVEPDGYPTLGDVPAPVSPAPSSNRFPSIRCNCAREKAVRCSLSDTRQST